MEKTAQELRDALLEAIEKIIRCYDFVQQHESTQSRHDRQDGIYLIYEDGHAVPFDDGDNPAAGVKYIGVAFQGHSFAVSLTESRAQLLRDDTEALARNDYKNSECDALYDFDCLGNTQKLVVDNYALADLLNPGEAIPTLCELTIICHLCSQINVALAYVGGDQLAYDGYWSSTEGGRSAAWIVYFGSGTVYLGSKYYGYAVRAVAAF